MNAEQEDFEALRRLLALKRHEQPPPGFFNDFSRQVVARIQATRGEPYEESLLERLFGKAPWVARLWEALETKPALAGAFGVLVCGLLISGIIYSEKAPVEPMGPVAVLPGSAEGPDKPVEMAVQAVPTPLIGQATPAGFSSTMGAASAQSPDSLFDEIQRLRQQPSAFLGAHADLISFQK
jgi:hypothetical protein